MCINWTKSQLCQLDSELCRVLKVEHCGTWHGTRPTTFLQGSCLCHASIDPRPSQNSQVTCAVQGGPGIMEQLHFVRSLDPALDWSSSVEYVCRTTSSEHCRTWYSTRPIPPMMPASLAFCQAMFDRAGIHCPEQDSQLLRLALSSVDANLRWETWRSVVGRVPCHVPKCPASSTIYSMFKAVVLV